MTENPMTFAEVLTALYALMAFLIIASLVAIEANDLLSSVIGVDSIDPVCTGLFRWVIHLTWKTGLGNSAPP